MAPSNVSRKRSRSEDRDEKPRLVAVKKETPSPVLTEQTNRFQTQQQQPTPSKVASSSGAERQAKFRKNLKAAAQSGCPLAVAKLEKKREQNRLSQQRKRDRDKAARDKGQAKMSSLPIEEATAIKERKRSRDNEAQAILNQQREVNESYERRLAILDTQMVATKNAYDHQLQLHGTSRAIVYKEKAASMRECYRRKLSVLDEQVEANESYERKLAALQDNEGRARARKTHASLLKDEDQKGEIINLADSPETSSIPNSSTRLIGPSSSSPSHSNA